VPKTKWGTYVLAISDNQSEISKAAGVAQSTVSRWMAGEQPKPVSVISLARHYRMSPVAALVAAGFLKASEITDSGVQPRGLAMHEFTELELAKEIVRRIEEGSNTFDEPAVVGADAQTSTPQSDREVAENVSQLNVRRKASSPDKVAASDREKK
jgi:transcriptional regulator with XRE-family HTH domain